MPSYVATMVARERRYAGKAEGIPLGILGTINGYGPTPEAAAADLKAAMQARRAVAERGAKVSIKVEAP